MPGKFQALCGVVRRSGSSRIDSCPSTRSLASPASSAVPAAARWPAGDPIRPPSAAQMTISCASLGQGVRQRQLQVGLVLGCRRGDDRRAAGRPSGSFVSGERVEVADQQVHRPAPRPRMAAPRSAAITRSSMTGVRRPGGCAWGLPPIRKMRKGFSSTISEQQKRRPCRVACQILTLRPYAGITRQVHGVIGMSSGTAEKSSAMSKGADLSARLTQLPLPGVFSGQQPLIARWTYRAICLSQT